MSRLPPARRTGRPRSRGFQKHGDYYFPATITHSTTSKDFQRGWWQYEDRVKIRGIELNVKFAKDTFVLPEPQPGMRVRIAYPKADIVWNTQPPIESHSVRDSVRLEHSLIWSEAPQPEDVRAWVTSRHWRTRSNVERALTQQSLLPFLGPDESRIRALVPDLATALKSDESEWTRRDAARALAKLGGAEALTTLKRLRDQEPQKAVRFAIEEGLRQMGEPLSAKRLQSVIGNGTPGSPWNNAVWFARRSAGDAAPFILAQCLEFDNPVS